MPRKPGTRSDREKAYDIKYYDSKANKEYEKKRKAIRSREGWYTNLSEEYLEWMRERRRVYYRIANNRIRTCSPKGQRKAKRSFMDKWDIEGLEKDVAFLKKEQKMLKEKLKK